MTDHDVDLEWLLTQMPSLMGERSGFGAVQSALERAESFGGAVDTSNAWDAVEAARPHAARARRLLRIWALVALRHRKVLETYYLKAKAHPAFGANAHLGEFAAVAMGSSPHPQLEVACSNAYEANCAALIQRERTRAKRVIEAAHRAWREAKSQVLETWVAS